MHDGRGAVHGRGDALARAQVAGAVPDAVGRLAAVRGAVHLVAGALEAARIPVISKLRGPWTCRHRQPRSAGVASGTAGSAQITESSSGMRVTATTSPATHRGTAASAVSRETAKRPSSAVNRSPTRPSLPVAGRLGNVPARGEWRKVGPLGGVGLLATLGRLAASDREIVE